MNLHNKLQRLRQRCGLSQEELAARLGVARQTVSKWESGQAVPELDSLVALCDLFRLSLDRLVREDDCAPALLPEAASAQGLIPFILRAKRAAYAGHGPEQPAADPGEHTLLYTEAPWRYTDRYYGGGAFTGQETVWQGEQPVWGMTYAGRVLAEPFSGDFLKEALLHGSEAMPWRGPEVYQQGDWLYHMSAQGDTAWFAGQEEIFCAGVKVYECRFHGGGLR